jgi:glycosyltransferase involved in cell wall biosynthesis
MHIDIIVPTCKEYWNLKGLIQEIEDNTPEHHRLIVTCQPLSASKNRNYGLSYADSDIIVMLDDDILSFYPGWLTNLVYPLLTDKNIVLCSARLLTSDKKRCDNMGMVGDNDIYAKIVGAFNIDGIEYKRVTTAAIAFRKSELRFDENFKGSGYEDTDFMNQVSEKFTDMEFIVNNQCELIHLNRQVGQENQEIWQHNHDYYCRKYPWDNIAKSQKWWFKK